MATCCFCAVGLDTPTRTYAVEKEPTGRAKWAPPTWITCRVIGSRAETKKHRNAKTQKPRDGGEIGAGRRVPGVGLPPLFPAKGFARADGARWESRTSGFLSFPFWEGEAPAFASLLRRSSRFGCEGWKPASAGEGRPAEPTRHSEPGTENLDLGAQWPLRYTDIPPT